MPAGLGARAALSLQGGFFFRQKLRYVVRLPESPASSVLSLFVSPSFDHSVSKNEREQNGREGAAAGRGMLAPAPASDCHTAAAASAVERGG